MTIPRALFLGLLAAVVIVLVLLAAHGYHDDRLNWLLLLPLLALHGAAVWTPGDGWPRRLVRGAFGFAVAAAAGFATYLGLDGLTDWFRGMDGDWFLLLLVVLHAAVPGGTAAAADSPARGLALAGGLTLGLCLASELAGNSHPGYIILLAVGTSAGALVNALDLRRPRSS
ncbi:hypothetical protein [Nannocystis punicea]|uniref:Uncharacterized protein n=1 Tax=Nannocystis punicea TaxID=2995304 RepID=A0ABY7GV37_9BACT|nr:hypothetical protein [Nannocystis poenicansa]WAS90816.1 hypothetical protein O0S08_31900 [Nannocystis poenicansa]